MKYAALILCLLLCSCATPFPYDDYDYHIDSLSLGLAFPTVNTAAALADTVAAMADLELGHVRIGEDWSLREPADDVFNWAPLESRLSAFQAAGTKVLLSIESHAWPSWLNSTGSHAEAETLDQFRAYVRELLRLQGSRIEYIQFGNEWNWEIDDYLAGDPSAFVAYTNILHAEVLAYRAEGGYAGPIHVLGSYSGGDALAYDQGLLAQIVIGGTPVYQDRVKAYAALAPGERISVRTGQVLRDSAFEVLDIHLYDNSQDWDKCVSAYTQALADAGKADLPLIVSEFGGPWARDLYPVFGKPSKEVLAMRLVDYVHALDALPVQVAYFFKLNEAEVYHDDSYLVDAGGNRMPAFEVLRRFASR